MPGSTYSSNLKIELMTTGENSGTWGDVTNTNLGTALEQAIIGYGNPDYTSDANLTITITNSNASQAARCLVLNVTSVFGSLTATRELIVPTSQKQYIVQNNTTGGQSITVKTSAGTGITVPNGRKAHLYVNGTDVIQMFDFVDINGGAIDGTPIGAASASTGAFTTLSATGNVTLSGGTINGVAYLNGSKVVTTGSALTFDGSALSVSASVASATLASSGAYSALSFTNSGGAASSGTILTNSSGILQSRAATHAYTNADASSEYMRISGATGGVGAVGIGYSTLTSVGNNGLAVLGNVGIGTSSPAYKLQVANNGNFNTTVNVSNTTAGTSSYARFLSISDGGNASFGMTSTTYTDVTSAADSLLINASGASGGIVFAHDGVGKMLLDSSGNLGLGVTPSAWGSSVKAIQIGVRTSVWNFADNSYFSTNSYFDGTNSRYIQTQFATLYSQQNDGAHKFYVAPSGTAGLGAVAAGSMVVGQSYTIYTSGNTNWVGSGAANNNVGTTFVCTSGSSGTGTATQNITFTQAMTLDASGNLGIGTTSPAYKLDVLGNVNRFAGASVDGIFLSTVAATDISYYGANYYNNNGTEGVNASGRASWRIATLTSGSPTFSIGYRAASAGAGVFSTPLTIDSSGNLGIGATNPQNKLQVVTTTRPQFSVSYNGTTGLYLEDATNSSWKSWKLSTSFSNGSDLSFVQSTNTSGTPTWAATAAMILDASGNLMVGGAGYTNKRISSIVPASWTGSAFYGEAQTSFTGGVYFSVTATAAGTGWYHMVCQSSGGTNNLLIFGNGNVQNANNSYGAISDAKLKENIVDATPKLEKLMQVRIRNYNLKGEYEQHKQIGVVAQELEQVFPSMVEETTDRDAEGNDLGTTTKSVKYSVFVPMLIKAMQELKAEFDAYKASHP